MNLIRIRPVSLSVPRMDFVFVTCIAVSAMLAASNGATAQEVFLVAPAGFGLENVEGNASCCAPPLPFDGFRVQYAYLASDFFGLPDNHDAIVSMAFRPDKVVTSPHTTSADLELRLSTTNTFSGTFANNVGLDETLVYSGPMTFQTAGEGPVAGPRPFDFLVEFQTPFVYDPQLGDLLVDVRFLRTNLQGQYDFDLQSVPGPPRTARAHADNALQASTLGSSPAVIEFSFGPDPFRCNFDSEGSCNTVDIDLLGAAITDVSTEPRFDLNNDGDVNRADQTKWLSNAATHNGFGEAYLLGDSDLDGSVDATDLNNLALNWRKNVARWSGGDFTADGVVNSADLNELALNWRGFIPFAGTLPIKAGSDAYVQTFDEALGTDGTVTGTKLPAGWTVIDNGIVGDSTMHPFPIGPAIRGSSATTTTFNAGTENDPDRTLAVGVSGSEDDLAVQLLAHAVATDADSFQLQFDVEAWDSADGIPIGNSVLFASDDPGEAALKLTVDIDSGDGFTSLVDLGTVTTGPTLEPVFEGIVDGNVDANRVSFDSGVVSASILAGSKLRFRWAPDFDAQTNGWVFGLDNVSLSLFTGGSVAAPAIVPEPSSLLLTILGVGLVCRRTRHN